MLVGGEVRSLIKLVKLQTASKNDGTTDDWIQHLVNTIIIKHLNLSHHLQMKILHESSVLKNK